VKIVQCNKNHYYDADKYSECPHCKNGLKKCKIETFEDKVDYGTVSNSIDDKPVVSEEMIVDPDKTEELPI